MSIYTSLDDEMVCPLCGETNTHIDQVAMAARPQGEDGVIVEIGVTAAGELVHETASIPSSSRVGTGRRHRVALYGWREACDGRFAWLFTQHKGVTLVEVVDLAAEEAA